MPVLLNLRGMVFGDRYEITEPLGGGGMGEVWLAKDTKFRGSPLVAVKVLRPSQDAGEAWERSVERFRREAENARKLSGNPHVVSVSDVAAWHYSDADGTLDLPYLVMDYIPGDTLEKEMAERRKRHEPFSVEDAAGVMSDVLDALRAAHRENLIHRDVKPANILHDTRNGSSAYLLTDFGLAKETDENETLTDPGSTMGTASYMAPEMARGQAGEFGKQGDVYSAGVVYWELLTGFNPFARNDDEGPSSRTGMEQVPPLAQKCPGAPRALSRFLARLTDRSPLKRPQDAVQAFAEHEEMLASLTPAEKEWHAGDTAAVISLDSLRKRKKKEAKGEGRGADGTALEARAAEFARRWDGKGDEKQDSQRFWIDLLDKVLGLHDAIGRVEFEHKTASGGYIDVLFTDAMFLAEQKSLGVSLDRPETRQGTQVTPIEQAKRYADALPPSIRPRILCTCNFGEFRFYDLEADPLARTPEAQFALEDLPSHVGFLASLFADGNARRRHQQEISETAGRLVAAIHNAIAKQYRNPDDPASHHALAVLTVRLVFCMYAEDARLFPESSFSELVSHGDVVDLRRNLIDLFRVLNTPADRRDPYDAPGLLAFPYVNGGLYAENVEIPQFTDEIRAAILDASEGFDWTGISPVIFGSLMEETLSHDQRRMGGMHYTTVRNIHRVIDPLFLDALEKEFDDIEATPVKTTGKGELPREYRRKLGAFQDKLASLQFLDPACGSGNFLTETYLCLRRLENRVLTELYKGLSMLDLGDDYNPVKVSIDQMHGIEINDFAVSVARTALWIAEQQALDETETIAGNLPHLPLHDSGNIVCANALRYDWNELLPGGECDYVMGNPPFIGRGLKSDAQVEDVKFIWGKQYDGNMDYVTCWYKKAGEYLTKPEFEFAFVSTSSICQGVPVARVFKSLDEAGWHIRFAHRTFEWDAQSTDMAHVQVVIIGMTRQHVESAILYEYTTDDTTEPVVHTVPNINGYLLAGPDVYVEQRKQSLGPLGAGLNLCYFGSKPTDGGHLIISTKEEYEDAMADPIAAKYVRPFRMGDELINNTDRWCLWLDGASPRDMRASRFLKDRIDAVMEMRLASKAASTRAVAKTPWLFKQRAQPDADYLAIPAVFGERRAYATCAYYTPDIIAGNKIYTCTDPDGFNFAIIESRMFLTWQKSIGGRLGLSCSFSNTVVWNTLPLPKVDDTQRAQIIAAGKAVLAARANHPESSLADLYDPTFMPPDLRKAHESLDKLVDAAFGADKWLDHNDDARLAILFDDYVRLTAR